MLSRQKDKLVFRFAPPTHENLSFSLLESVQPALTGLFGLLGLIQRTNSPSLPMVLVNTFSSLAHPRNPTATARQDASADFSKGIRTLGCYGDYLVVNVSSPNTPGLRDLQRVKAIKAVILAAMDARDQVRRRRARAQATATVLFVGSLCVFKE